MLEKQNITVICDARKLSDVRELGLQRFIQNSNRKTHRSRQLLFTDGAMDVQNYFKY